MHITESLCCIAEINTTLQINDTSTKTTKKIYQWERFFFVQIDIW